MTKHDVWHTLNGWKVRIALVVAILTTTGVGITQSEAIITKVDRYFERYINARVDHKIKAITDEVSALKDKVEDNTKEVERNNKELKRNTELLDVLIKEMAKKTISG